jgi:GNAT superfamily N-acetyltransferase
MATGLISIRTAKAEHADALASAHADAWRLAYQGIIPHLHLERMIARRGSKWWGEAIARRSPVLVLEYDGEAVGYTTFGRARRQGSPYQGEIFEIYVSPVYQGLGFGGRLFRAARSALLDARLSGLFVWALADNEMACAFYRHLGGRPVAEDAETYGNVVLQKIAFAWD